MARLYTAVACLALVACATAPPIERMSLEEALADPPPDDVTYTEAPSSLADATRRFEETARRERRSTPRGAPMPQPYVLAWGAMLDAIDGVLAQPAERLGALELARTRLLVETSLDADVGAFGDVSPALAERIPATLRRLSVRLRALTAKPYRAAPPHFSWPTSPVVVTSAWGARVHPVYGEVRFHAGVDLWGRRAQVVRAASAGIVAFAGWNGGHGKQIELQHDAHLETRYSHLQRILVEVGSLVNQGDIIGLVGETGLVTGPHLHFELRQDGQPIDPEKRLPPPSWARHSSWVAR